MIEKMRGLTFVSVQGASEGSEEVVFSTETQRFVFWHESDCCETVRVAQIDGDPGDLLREPLVMAEESSEKGDDSDGESRTWTFYKFATAKGYVTIRWLGVSNGYYSERVSLREEPAA